MKQITIILLILAGCSTANLDDARALGTKKFDTEKWLSLPNNERSVVVYSLLKQHDVTAMNAKDITSLLGIPTAYYDYDEFPAYIIGPKTILAFPVDRQSGLVRKYLIITQK